MAVWAGHCHLAGCRARDLAVPLTPHRIGDVCSHRAALGAPDAPIPLTDDDLHLFGRHSALLAALLSALLAALLSRRPAALPRLSSTSTQLPDLAEVPPIEPRCSD